MKIYIEYIFLLNFLLDFMILFGTKRLLNINTKIIRIILGSLLGSLTTFILYIDITTIELLILKLLLSILIILISFGKRNLFNNLFYFYLISIIIGGIIYLFDLLKYQEFYYLLLIILFPCIITIFIKEFKNYHITLKNKYNVVLIINKKKYELSGFIDTGNTLKDPITKKNIILVNLNIKYKNVIYVPYKALNTSGIIPCLKPDKIIIDKKEINNCLIGLSKDKFEINNLNCILPNKLKEELCLN